MQVDFAIVGAQKCGTTTLYDILNTHPDLVGSRVKEPHFFLAPDWRARLNDYHSLFAQRPGAKYFEASTSYTFFPLRRLGIWHDMFEYNPAMKFIYLVRNPIDRIVSNFVHVYERSTITASIDEELRTNRFYLDVTRYHTQIMPFIRKFGRDRVMLIDFDDLIEDRETVMRDLSEFLEVDPEHFGDYADVHSNASGDPRILQARHYSPPPHLRVIRKFAPRLWRRITDNSKRILTERPTPNAESRELVQTMLDLEVRGLEELLEKDLSAWLPATDSTPT